MALAADTFTAAVLVFVATRCAATAWWHTKIGPFANIVRTADAAIVTGANFSLTRYTDWIRDNDGGDIITANTATTVPSCTARADAITSIIHDQWFGALVLIILVM